MFETFRSGAARLLTVSALGAPALLSCTGIVDGAKANGGPAGPVGTQPSAAGSSGTATAGAAGVGVANLPNIPVGPSAGRRLTKSEYLHTVSDLLGVDLSAADDAGTLPDDQPPTGAGFRNDIDGLLPTSTRTDAYETLAQRVSDRIPWASGLATYADCADATDACRSGFVSRLGRVLFRRTLSDDDVSRFTPLFDDADPAGNFENGARLVLQAMLQSPHFLYRLERLDRLDPATGKPAPSAFELATRLSYLAWQSAPTPELLAAAEQGSLSGSTFAATVDGLLQSPNARRGFQGYAEDWLQLYRLDVRTPNADQGVTPALLTEMKEEVLRFATRVAFTEGRPFKEFFTDRKTELGPALAQVYGVTPLTQGFSTFDLSADPHRVGILTQPGFLILRAAPERATIVHRGLMVLRLFFCSEVPAPPPNAATQAASIPTNLTDRDRFALHTAAPTCKACHNAFDPLGYPFEPFDLAGHFRIQDEFGNTLRSDGDLSLNGTTQHFDDTAQFATLLAESPDVQRCFVSKMLQYGLGRGLTSQDTPALDVLAPAFESAGGTYQAALSAVAKSDAFRAMAPAE